MNKQLVAYGCLVAVMFVGGFLLFRSGVTKANYDRITTQLTKAEIEYILGGLLHAPAYSIELGGGGVDQYWLGYEGEIRLIFDEQDRIIWKEWDEHKRRVSLMDQLLNGGRVLE